MDIEPTAHPDVKIIIPKRHGDARGFFSETWRREALAAAGFDFDFVQDNHSLSGPVGTLRGLHFQTPPAAQVKLVRVVRGAVWDVAVDIRRGSPRFAQWVGVELSAENWRQMLIPAGFAHGFVTLAPETEVLYKVTDYYAPAHDTGILWNDSDLGIPWPLPPGGPVLSAKDRELRRLADLPPIFT